VPIFAPMSHPESQTGPLPVGGIDRHVAVARLRPASGGVVETFTRGIGRNRVAVLARTPMALGEQVRFELSIGGGTVGGVGQVERMHVQPVPGGEPEVWAVIDFQEVEPTGEAQLVRALFRSGYAQTALNDRMAARRNMGAPDDLRPTRTGIKPAEPDAPKRKRPQVGRYAPPESGSRWRVR
jgi:hypothetical protein